MRHIVTKLTVRGVFNKKNNDFFPNLLVWQIELVTSIYVSNCFENVNKREI